MNVGEGREMFLGDTVNVRNGNGYSVSEKVGPLI